MLRAAHLVFDPLKRFLQRNLNLATLGVRAIVVNPHQEVLLVKHTYKRGWYLPGGGVERNEHPDQAIERELKEEVGIFLQEPPRLLHVFCHQIRKANDYPFLYEVINFYQSTSSCAEIAELAWFKYEDLPAQTTPATKRRLQEYYENKPSVPYW